MNEVTDAFLGAWGLPPIGPRKVYRDKPVKQCAHCGNDHQHNNRFCSAECCRAFERTPAGGNE